ncbi:MAG TPA: lysylphosphatidylglycerol synthase transmembrane domain-containing protein [Acidimicrobiales bacterium]
MSDSPPGRAPARHRALALPTLVGVVVGGACAAFVVRALTSQWSQVRDEVAGADVRWLVAAVVLGGAGMVWVAWCWRDALALLGHRPPRRATVAWYFAGEIGKYVPGGVWTVVGRGELARRGGVPGSRAYPSVALSLAALYLSALVVVVLLVPFDLAEQAASPGPLALLLLLPLGLGALHPAVLGRARAVLHRLTGRGGEMPLPPWRDTVALVVRYLPAWLAIWAATWCVARAVIGDPPVLRLGVATLLSWTAGVVAVPVPAGAGVREAVFLAASGLPAGLAATVAVGGRLVFLLVDVGGALVTAPWHRRPGEGVGGEPPPGAHPAPDTASLQSRRE